MINILMLMAGKSSFFPADEYQFSKPLIEINGKSMIGLAIKNLNNIKEEKKFVYVVQTSDCDKYHIDAVLSLLTESDEKIVKINGETKGAACSALMAIEHINNDEKLIISNYDQIIEEDLNTVLEHFEKRDVDAGVVCIETVHPRWSYVSIDGAGKIIAAVEKRPISKNAIAGFYYFKKGSDFVKAAMESIKKEASVEGKYYIAPTLNEMILENKNLEMYKINNDKYHTFYSPQKIHEYEKERGRD